MSKKKPTAQPRGPGGVPVDAPGNDAPAISPPAVSRMHRAEDDPEAAAQSPEFTDQPAVAQEGRPESQHWVPGSPGSGQRDDASRGLDGDDPKRGQINPSHDTHKAPEEPPRGRYDGERMEQPDSQAEAREPGPDPSKFDD